MSNETDDVRDRRNPLNTFLPIAMGVLLSIGSYYVIDYIKTRDTVVELAAAPPNSGQWVSHMAEVQLMKQNIFELRAEVRRTDEIANDLRDLIDSANATLTSVNSTMIQIKTTQEVKLSELERRLDKVEH